MSARRINGARRRLAFGTDSPGLRVSHGARRSDDALPSPLSLPRRAPWIIRVLARRFPTTEGRP